MSRPAAVPQGNLFQPGYVLRLAHWTECGVVVVDVGLRTFWGRVIILGTDKWVEEKAFPLEDGWHPVWNLPKGAEN